MHASYRDAEALRQKAIQTEISARQALVDCKHLQDSDWSALIWFTRMSEPGEDQLLNEL